MRSVRIWAPFLTLVVLLAGGVFLLQRGGAGAPEGVRAQLSAASAIAGGDTAGFARALEPREFRFPEDHGAHPEYRTEWWYLTGNVRDEAGDAFGFQVTFFRNALAPGAAGRTSEWDTNQIWMAHFALTDVAGGRHVVGERFARGAAGMAGATVEPFAVWLGDWELLGPTEGITDPTGAFPMVVRVRHEGAGVDLRLDTRKPPVLQGDRGLSQKGPEPGNASYYLSWTRLAVSGEIRVGESLHRVEGSAWMDREWSTSALGEEHVGWDWFSLQLGDGRDLMFFELRRRDGTVDPLNQGTLVDTEGGARHLAAEDVEVEVLRRWESPLDGASYPSGWRLTLPDEELVLEIEPKVADQEMNLSFRYWEGAVWVRGTSGGAPIEGVGYVELTGYGEGAGPGDSRTPDAVSP